MRVASTFFFVEIFESSLDKVIKALGVPVYFYSALSKGIRYKVV